MRGTWVAVMSVGLAMGYQTAGMAQSATLHGVETADLDRKAEPCTDFYEFSNGAWRAQNPIPASMDRWSRRWKAGEDNKDQLRVILDDVSSKPAAKGAPAQLTGDFYAACTNEQSDRCGRREAGDADLAADRCDQDAADLQAELMTLAATACRSRSAYVDPDILTRRSKVIADVGAGGLGLPDRDYYLKPEKRFAEARAGYLLHVAKIFELAGESSAEAKADAQTVMTFETALAKASLDNVTLRDPSATDHKMTFAQLEQLTPHFSWATYYRGAKLTPAELNVDQPEFMKEVERQLTGTPIAQWKTYLRWQVLNSFADKLSTPLQ